MLLASSDQGAVGLLGLEQDLALLLPTVGGTPAVELARDSGSALNVAEFLDREGDPSPAVIGIMGQQMPGQDSKLSCHRHKGDCLTTPRSNPLVEGTQRPRYPYRCVSRFD